MTPELLVLDDVLVFPNAARTQIKREQFTDYTDVREGITYPTICAAVPQWLRFELVHALSNTYGEIKVRECFARLTLPGADAPNKIHTDVAWGQFAAHLQLSKPPMNVADNSGISFWKHKTEHDVFSAQNDANDPTKWERTCFILWRYNRLVVHRAAMWHCAEPVGGWGGGVADGRLVITTFFDRV